MLPAQFESGYGGARLYAEANQMDCLCYVEQWATEQDLERQICSRRFGVLLAITESAVEAPSVEIHTISESRDLEYVREIRLKPRPGGTQDATPA